MKKIVRKLLRHFVQRKITVVCMTDKEVHHDLKLK